MTALAEVASSFAEVDFDVTEVPHALYRLYDAEDSLLYLGITWNLPQRMEGHAADKDWWPLVTRQTMVWYPSEWDARKAEAEAIDAENPLHNKQKPTSALLRHRMGNARAGAPQPRRTSAAGSPPGSTTG